MILVFSPHGDDAELAMGATIARMCKGGARVVHVILTVSSYRSSKQKDVAEQDRVLEAGSANAVLGAEVVFADFVDNDISSEMGRLVALMDRMILGYRPSEVYVCLPWFNADHVAVYSAAVAAMRKMPSGCTFYGYEMPGQGLGFDIPSLGWEYREVGSDDLEAKIAALKLYHSQGLECKPGVVSVRGTKAKAELDGLEAGVNLAERFLFLRGVKEVTDGR